MNDEQVKHLLRSAFPQPERKEPTRDLWPSIVRRIEMPRVWSRIDIVVAAGLLAGIAVMLVVLPKALLLLAYL